MVICFSRESCLPALRPARAPTVVGALLLALLLAGPVNAGCDGAAAPDASGATVGRPGMPLEPAAAGPSAQVPTHLSLGSVSEVLVDRSTRHTVSQGDNLTLIGARYGVSTRLLIQMNGLDPKAPLRVGQQLIVVARHVVPASLSDGMLINLPQRMVYLFRDGRVTRGFPVAVGRPAWPTPTGDFTVINRQTDKTWYVPKSIQEEMRREGKPVLTEVPPGPDNPLGRHWIGLSLPAIGLHGTIAPASIYGFRSHGCVRMHPDDVADLFDQVAVGDPGRIVYEPLLLARDGDGRIWFEANPDAYRRGGGTLDTVRAMARDKGIAEGEIDWARVATMLRERDGLAREAGSMTGADWRSATNGGLR